MCVCVCVCVVTAAHVFIGCLVIIGYGGGPGGERRRCPGPETLQQFTFSTNVTCFYHPVNRNEKYQGKVSWSTGYKANAKRYRKDQ